MKTDLYRELFQDEILFYIKLYPHNKVTLYKDRQLIVHEMAIESLLDLMLDQIQLQNPPSYIKNLLHHPNHDEPALLLELYLHLLRAKSLHHRRYYYDHKQTYVENPQVAQRCH